MVAYKEGLWYSEPSYFLELSDAIKFYISLCRNMLADFDSKYIEERENMGGTLADYHMCKKIMEKVYGDDFILVIVRSHFTAPVIRKLETYEDIFQIKEREKCENEDNSAYYD
jgi:hypothetical protein